MSWRGLLNLSPRAEADGGAEPAEASLANPRTAASGTLPSRQTGPAKPGEELDDLPF
jgi:hypothetical protein